MARARMQESEVREGGVAGAGAVADASGDSKRLNSPGVGRLADGDAAHECRAGRVWRS